MDAKNLDRSQLMKTNSDMESGHDLIQDTDL